jgi:hypothetical protein
MGVFTCRPSASGVWIEFEQGDPGLSDLGRRLLGHGGRGAGALPHGAPGGARPSRLQTTLKNGIVISDVPGPTGGIMIKSADRRHDHR